ncbi:RNA 2',3'-cyclic phosphodiesterase [Alkalihalobacterium bogoriense]|uniref:RNA 2',3'-cyclic phosphodiesterase n=1 Tax=Alkalihalobacterium bogoriense TaxID=246272 RepID=UPI00047A6F08|nr:RNA 2',3'-cyclic phosphodiesterase [Alkalihalobacterium bogoriense]
MENTHFFLAIPISKEIKEIIHRWREQHHSNWTFKRWVHKEDYHITLVFLGNATKEQRQALDNRLKEKIVHVKPFELTLSSLGVFGKPERPRILWGGVEQSSPLHELQHMVARICYEVGFTIETRAYKPHITIARQWSGQQPFDLPLTPLTDKVNTWQVNELVLYQTHLQRSPKYEAILQFPFQN